MTGTTVSVTPVHLRGDLDLRLRSGSGPVREALTHKTDDPEDSRFPETTSTPVPNRGRRDRHEEDEFLGNRLDREDGLR